MKKNNKYMAVLFIIFLLISCEKSSNTNTPKSIEDLLIKNNEISGWTYDGSGWTANNIPELTTYIDGEADLFQRYGFIEAVYQKYQGNINSAQVTIEIYIYNQSNRNNASELYNDPLSGRDNPIEWQNGAGESSYYQKALFDQNLRFFRNQYYVRLNISSSSDEALNVMKQFALNVDGKMK
jgi:hypothetical protein